MKIDALVFDFDGVIVDSEQVSVDLDRRLLAGHGVVLSVDEVAARFTGCTDEFRRVELSRLLGFPVGQETEAQLEVEYEERFELVQGMPGVVDALAALTLPKAIASNNSAARIRRTLHRLGLETHFGGRISVSDNVEAGKPAPDVYLRAASMLGVAPDRCIAVEDSRPGIRSARAAGMKVFGLVNSFTPVDAVVAEGAMPFTSMLELPALVDAVAGGRSEVGVSPRG